MGFQKGFSDGSQVYIQKMAGNVVTAFIRGDDVYVFIGEIEYVHQFQNAYFAINKREATFTGISKYTI